MSEEKKQKLKEYQKNYRQAEKSQYNSIIMNKIIFNSDLMLCAIFFLSYSIKFINLYHSNRLMEIKAYVLLTNRA